jgi:hypothetical protein
MRIQIPNDPERWRTDASVRPAGADVLLRGARRPQLPASEDLARLGTAIDEIPRRSALAARRWTRLTSAAAGIATLIALGTGVWAWRGRQLVATGPTVAPPADTPIAARALHGQRAQAPGVVVPERPAPPPARRAVHNSRAAKATASTAAPAPSDALVREIALIDAAREQVSRAPARALTALDTHRHEFPTGQLAAEREFLAVEALRRLGRIDDARGRAAALAAQHPQSSYAARAQRALSGP